MYDSVGGEFPSIGLKIVSVLLVLSQDFCLKYSPSVTLSVPHSLQVPHTIAIRESPSRDRRHWHGRPTVGPTPQVALALLHEILTRQIHTRRKMLLIPEDTQELLWDTEIHVLALQQFCDDSDGTKTLVSDGIPTARVEDARTDDRSKVLEIHLASGDFVHVGEGGNPFEEYEKYLHRIPVALGKQ